MLVDTDILIDYFREYPQAVDFIETNIDRVMVSSISVAELYQGVRDGKEREALDAFMSAVSILSVDETIGKKGGLYRREFRLSHNSGLADCLIAATASQHGIALKTLNVKHYPMLEEVEAPYTKD